MFHRTHKVIIPLDGGNSIEYMYILNMLDTKLSGKKPDTDLQVSIPCMRFRYEHNLTQL